MLKINLKPIKLKMFEKEWKAKDLARASGLKVATVYGVLRARTQSPKSVNAILKALGLKLNDVTN